MGYSLSVLRASGGAGASIPYSWFVLKFEIRYHGSVHGFQSHSHRAAAKAAKGTAVAQVKASVNTGDGLNNPDLYINRELSLLEFQSRVLEEAADATNPLLERVKFLAILGSNLDEFFMVRVAGLTKQVVSGTAELGRDGSPFRSFRRGAMGM